MRSRRRYKTRSSSILGHFSCGTYQTSLQTYSNSSASREFCDTNFRSYTRKTFLAITCVNNLKRNFVGFILVIGANIFALISCDSGASK